VDEVDRWLVGTVAEVLEMQRPALDDAIVVVPLDRAASKAALGSSVWKFETAIRASAALGMRPNMNPANVIFLAR